MLSVILLYPRWLSRCLVVDHRMSSVTRGLDVMTDCRGRVNGAVDGIVHGISRGIDMFVNLKGRRAWVPGKLVLRLHRLLG